jgi:PAS domain S-box-containing protein
MTSESLLPGNKKHFRLLKALRESEILRELSELLASSLDLTRILQVLATRTTEVCEVERCAVWLLDESQHRFLPATYHVAAPHLKAQDIDTTAHLWYKSSLPFDDPVTQRLLQANGLLELRDSREEPSMRALTKIFHIRTVLLVALLREGRPVGMISLDNPGKTGYFTDEQQQLARAIGQQAAVAIDNARLYQQAQEERNRAERLIGRAQAIYQVAMAVNSDKDLPDVLEIASQHLVRELSADGVPIALNVGNKLMIVNSTRLSPLPPSSAESFITPGLNDLPHCLAAARQEKPYFVKAGQTAGLEKQWFDQLGLQDTLIVPFIVAAHHRLRKNPAEQHALTAPQIVGFAFATYRRNAGQPSSGQLAFAQDIATQCALAIDKANLLAEAHQAATLATEHANTLDAVFNAMTEGIVVLDLEGKIVVRNNTLAHFMGVPAEPGTDLRPYWQEHPAHTLHGTPIYAEDFPLMRALRGEQIFSERFMAERADGSQHLLEVHIAPLFDNAGNRMGVVGAFRDITEQMRVEQRIRRALDTMLHAAEVVSGITDTREMLKSALAMALNTLNSECGAVQLYNQAQQSFVPLLSIGFPEDDDEARWLSKQKIWLEPDEQQLSGFRAQLLEGHTILVNAEQSPDQADFFQDTMILAAPITYNNQLLGVIILDRSMPHREKRPDRPGRATHQLPPRAFSVWDMAVAEGIAQFAGLAMEQARWQQEARIARTNEATMRESNKLKDEFLAITAHEFRTPLTVILAYSQILARQLKKVSDLKPEVREKFQESIDNIETQAHHLTNIVNTFLEVTRLNRGQIVLSQTELNLEDLVKEAVEMQSATAKEYRITYTIKAGKRPYLFKGDKARILQVLANLLQNAVKYSPPGTPITVSLHQFRSPTGQWLAEVSVKDNGIGIPKEAQPHLFERFYRAPNTVESQTRGVGLGLYVVAEFLRLHGGTIRIESSGMIGEGSRFIFTLPLLASLSDQP